MRKLFDVLAPFPFPVPAIRIAAPREMDEYRQDNAGTVYIAEWTEERDEVRMRKKNEKKKVQLIRKPSQADFFARHIRVHPRVRSAIESV